MDLSSRINYRFFFLLARGENKRGKGGGGGGEGVRGMEIGHHRPPYVFLTGMIEAVSQRRGNNTGGERRGGDICPWKQSIGD